MFQRFQKILRSPHVKFGVPFLGLLVGSPFALTYVTSFRYEFRKTQELSEEQLEEYKDKGILKRGADELSLENLYEEYIDKNQESLDNYENLRIPRPWEDETKVDDMRKSDTRLKLKSISQIKQEKSEARKKSKQEKLPAEN